MGKVKAIPDGFNTVSAYLVVPDSAKAIELYQKAFGAREKYRMAGPGDQGVMHAGGAADLRRRRRRRL